MARKKIIFVIMEGPSDEEALGVIFNHIFDSSTVYVHIMHGDITTEFNNDSKKIVARVGDEIKAYASSNHFKKSDFKEIIHIVDMDGAYIEDSYVMEDALAMKPIYWLTEIRTCNKQGIEQRNKRKCNNIDRLSNIKDIWDIPYKIFYMSCNLDHALYNKLNSDVEEKERDSFRFAKAYKDRIQDFLIFISKSDFPVMTGYKESWNFIKKNLHSLERFTNLGLCFEDITLDE